MRYIDAEKLSENEVWRDCVCNPRKPTYGGVRKRVLKKDINGNIVARYASVTEASKANNIAQGAVSNNLNGRTKICGGFKYEYE